MVEQDRIGDEAESVGERRSGSPWLSGVIGLVVMLVGGLIFIGARVLAPNGEAESPPPPPEPPVCAPADVKIADGKPMPRELPEPLVTLPTGCLPPEPGAAITFADVVVGDGAEVKQGAAYLAYFALYDLGTGKLVASHWKPEHKYGGLTGGKADLTGDLWSRGLAGMKSGGRRVLLLPAVTGELAQDPVEMFRTVPLVAVVDVTTS
ncbi:hypothetical protein [Amycolatopsis sp. lyj-112]|uniref:hypothetical protein n=1 Tax=Amycolatopsis sp. lyj-112 TaxID=2789288 RepID=UPI00397997B2